MKGFNFNDLGDLLALGFAQAQRRTALLTESSVLAEKINRARFDGVVPDADDTVRLCKILDILLDMGA